jgi:predicted transcriptional regulator
MPSKEQLEVQNEHYSFILISDEKNWNKLREQKRSGKGTQVFIRKNFVGPVKTKQLFFYVKRPVKEIRGKADFVERIKGDHREIWEKYGGESCFSSFKEYSSFIEGREQVTFVRFKNFEELKNPISAEAFNMIVGSFLMPRGGKYLNLEKSNKLSK